MKTQLLFLALLLLATGCKRSTETAPASSTNQASSSGNPMTAPVDYLGSIANAKKVSEKTINLASLNNAIQQFNAMEERFPKDLNELVEKHYLSSVPAAPAGMKLAYNPQTGEIKIFKP
ncbi:MAG: hypothetical protein L0Z50_04245 [Verrucomicrobiales bacterium]|nr:hypothetical protein [Verrucomicrobiales bacterium]